MSTAEVELLFLLELERRAALKNRDEQWYRGDLRFLLHEAQQIIYDAFHSNNWRETAIVAARRFGKSTLGFILCLEYGLRNPYQIARFVPPEIKQAWQIVLPTWGKLQQIAPRGLIEYVKAEQAFRVGQDSWIFLGGFDSQKDSQRGGEASFIVCDEGGSTNPEEYNYILKSVLKPQLLDTKGRMLHLGTVPPDLAHPFLTDTVHRAEIDERYFEFTIEDNPRLDDEQRQQAIDDCGGVDTEEYQREYMCKRVRTPHLMVCPNFERTRVAYAPPHPHYAWWEVVGDWGGVTDKTVFVSGWYDTKMFRWHIWDERVYEPHTPTETMAKGLEELVAGKSILMPHPFPHLDGIVCGHRDQEVIPWLDCPGQVRVDLHKLLKCDVRLPKKDEFDAGIKLLNHHLDRCKLLVNPQCKFILKSLEEGKLNPRRTDYERTEALGHCDGIAAVIYFLRMARLTNAQPPSKYDREVQWAPLKKTETNLDDIARKMTTPSWRPK